MMVMANSFDRWLERSLHDQLAPADAISPIAVRARYRRELLMQSRRRSRRGWQIALVIALMAILGTVGAEAAGYGPIKVGQKGIHVEIGTAATPNLPVASPKPNPSPVVAAPVPPTGRTGEAEDSAATRASSQATARSSESAGRETEGSPYPSHSASPYPTGSPEAGDH